MSFQNKNLYHLLGNDVEDDTIVHVAPKEIVKKTTSSKKSDVPPPSADPAKAKKKNTKAGGNEGAFKTRVDNKSTPGPVTAHKSTKKPMDRHSRSNKSDSKKKFKQGWGESDERRADGELEGTEDAIEEADADAQTPPAQPGLAKKSLADYFAELDLKQQALATAQATRKANDGASWDASQVIEKPVESFVAPTSSKKTKAKAQKTKTLLDFDATFADEKPERKQVSREGRGGARGGRGGARGGRAREQKPRKVAVDDVNFPSL